ncbi:MAG: hypothetical protein HYR85_01630 [Planctomycetes bacterium]|nr:hypothetical protein [Planctomycetota bacterium]MBI3845967.1 hypothetical protein [Planctomycetota bacterium]
MPHPVSLALDEASLRASLAECIAYCGERAEREPEPRDIASILRSDALRETALACLPPAYWHIWRLK